VTFQVGSGGTAGNPGGNTWFNGASLAASAVGAKGGGANSGPAGGPGGDAASGIGTTRYSGGAGGSSGNIANGGGGGGGAAGPNGAGQAGGPSAHNSGPGGGGAGGGSSTAGADSPTVNSNLFGGQGGTAQDGTAGGAAAVAGGSDAVAGSRGSGGGGGAADGVGTQRAGAMGGDGIEFDSTHGAGGGGGAAGNADYNGGGGGLYGGGGGATYYVRGTGVGGTGGQGIIVINYTPAASLTVTADAWVPPEFSATARRGDFYSIQFLASGKGFAPLPTETLRGTRHDSLKLIEACGVIRDYRQLSAEWAGALGVTADAPLPLECLDLRRFDTTPISEFGIGIMRDANHAAEWRAVRRADWGGAVEHMAAVQCRSGSPCGWAVRMAADAQFYFEWIHALTSDAAISIQLIAGLNRDVVSVLESSTNGSRTSIAGLLTMEWADPPALVLVSLERLLRSPGRIRILAGPGSAHPLRGQ
jgi:hypothetical protein